MPFKLMDPSDSLAWSHDWASFLADGDSVASQLWTIDPDSSPTLLTTPTQAIVTVSGLSAGTVYRLSEKMTTGNGEVGERSLTIRCEEI